MKNVYLLLILLLSISSNAFSKQFKHLDTSLSYEERVNHLMDIMTLDEKIAQMCQFVGLNYLASTSKNMTTEDILNSDSKASYPGLMTKDIADMIVDGKIELFYMFNP